MAIIREGAQLGDQELIIETGRMALQASGSVVIQYGDSQVLCTATAGDPRPDLPFLPLVCDYVENQWAAGSIPGGYFKREAKPSEKAVLTSRLIDRPSRPLFVDGYRHNTQLIAWVLSADRINDTDVLGITGCSAALMLSDIPWHGPLAGVRIGYVDGEFVANPTFAQRAQSEMDIVMAVSPSAIVMIEGEANEIPEDIMIDALEFGQRAVQDVLDLQLRLADALGKEKFEVQVSEPDPSVSDAVKSLVGSQLEGALQIKEKQQRYSTLDAIKAEAVKSLAERYPEQLEAISDAYSQLKKTTMRRMITDHGVRIDGRGFEDVRDVSCEVGLIPKAHGSALFTRGETQALVTCTLGTEKDAQRIDMLEGDETKRFLLHYNFPAFSVGEVRPMRSPGRREIGHGVLAERALVSSLPDLERVFPYTVRIVSDVLGSNGSSSMASVCGGSLALMDAGVPLKHATAGIAMGLIKEGDNIAILSDILGDEDHLGDMDFKVCGTERGITAFQLDTKIEGITRETMAKALQQARDGRIHILEIMNQTLQEARKDVSSNAPRIVTTKIKTDQIGLIIGPGGKTIRGIEGATGATLTIEEDGTVSVASASALAAQQAIEIIEGLTAEPEVGETYLGTVKTVVDFGAFIEILPGTEGLCHISELTEGRVEKVEDVLREGDECLVKVLQVDRQGKIRLSRREALSERGEVA